MPINGAVKYGLEVPPDFVLVGKALMTVEGIGKQIYPELDVFEAPNDELSLLEPHEVIGGFYHRVAASWKGGTPLRSE